MAAPCRRFRSSDQRGPSSPFDADLRRKPCDQIMKDAMNHWMHSNRSAWRAIVVGARALQACARRAWDFYRERRCTRLIYETLLELDDRTLRDLGFDRSEVMSV